MRRPLVIHAGEPPSPVDRRLHRRLPSRLDLKQPVMDEIASLLIGQGWVAEDDRPWVYLCLDEALVNAMLHGNEGDPLLEVDIVVHIDESRWIITVADQGHGFVASSVPDHEQPESLMLEHGRGIRIMQEWLDELLYYRAGRCAWLARRRADRDSVAEPVAEPKADT